MRLPVRNDRVLIVATAVLFGCFLVSTISLRSSEDRNQSSSTGNSEIFTPAHPTVVASLRDFLGWRRNPVQPIEYTHKVHLAKGLKCENCHAGAATGPQAGIPGVKSCMRCHRIFAVDRPEIKKIAAFQMRGEEIPWVRVYDYNASAHVRFDHGPHIRAEVPCETCHGDMTKQTTAQRVVDMNMGYCIDCHLKQKASIECVACHF